MPASSAVQVIGYRWESSGGHKACAQCRAMHGQEFYFEPHGSQRHVDEMPFEQLHPNCRCRRRSITAVRRPMNDEWVGNDTYGGSPGTTAPEQEPPPPGKGLWRDPVFGAVWRPGRIDKGPVYGNYGGRDWTGGRDVGDKEEKTPEPPSPAINQMDRHFKKHDEGYTHGENEQADHEANQKLLQGLKNLPKNPRDWDREKDDKPMTEQEIKDANKYRGWALGYFEGEVSTYNQKIRDRNEWGTDAE